MRLRLLCALLGWAAAASAEPAAEPVLGSALGSTFRPRREAPVPTAAPTGERHAGAAPDGAPSARLKDDATVPPTPAPTPAPTSAPTPAPSVAPSASPTPPPRAPRSKGSRAVLTAAPRFALTTGIFAVAICALLAFAVCRRAQRNGVRYAPVANDEDRKAGRAGGFIELNVLRDGAAREELDDEWGDDDDEF